MKAYTFTKYGSPEKVLELKDGPKPTPSPKEVLVKVRATSINDYDWAVITGKPFLYRLMFGLAKPRKKLQVPGMELSGTVEAVGAEVTGLKPGEAVYGDISDHGFGSFAEYICIDERALAMKPPGMGFTVAAALPHASMLALQGLRDMGKIRKGQQVLINGGGGGVGMLGLQIAKLYEAEVTGVDSEKKLKAMKDLGYDHVLDYRKTDFTRTGLRYDLILDCKITRTAFALKRALKSYGRYVCIGGEVNRLLQLLLTKSLPVFGAKKFHILALKQNRDLDYINQLYDEGMIRCIVDGPYPFENIPWAVEYFGAAKHTGKVVIEINSPS